MTDKFQDENLITCRKKVVNSHSGSGASAASGMTPGILFPIMASSQNLRMETRLGLRLTQQQLRFVKLLEMTAPELDEAVDRELADNPALEAGDRAEAAELTAVVGQNQTSESDVRTRQQYIGFSSQTPHTDDYIAADNEDNLYDSLYRQLGEKDLPPGIATAAEYIIGSLDPNGYLQRTPQQLADDMAFGPGLDATPAMVSEALDVVKSLEPYGVGASDLRECLRLQLVRLRPSQTRDDAIGIIDRHFDAFTMKHLHRIISGMHIDSDRASRAINLIRSLNPKPGSSIDNGSGAGTIIPDAMITTDEGDIRIILNNRIPELRIDQSFRQAVDDLERTRKNRTSPRAEKTAKGNEFITSRYDDAREFIRILSQRQHTMLSVVTAIVSHQKEYFLTQDVYTLRPMMIKDISAATGLDLSVISRATTNKYIATPWGIFPLRFFFSDSIGDEEGTDALTNRKMEAEIAAIVGTEDKRHPLSDEKIRQEMLGRGFDVSRRTVAKYRDRQGIPVARLRKEM